MSNKQIVKQQLKMLFKMLFNAMELYAKRFKMDCHVDEELIELTLEIIEEHSDLESLKKQIPMLTSALVSVTETGDNVGDPAVLFAMLFSSKEEMVAAFTEDLPEEYRIALGE